MDIAAAVARTPRGHSERRTVFLVACAVAGLAAIATAAAIAASNAHTHPDLVALARGLIVGVPIAAGIYTWWRRADERFGLLLVAAGAGSFLTTLAESSDSLVYSFGRVAGWFLEVLLVYLILSFPSGRLSERVDRLLVGVMGAVVLTLFVPRLALAESFEIPSPFTSCTEDCPANAFMLVDREPAFVDAVMRPLGTVLVFVVMVAVLLRLASHVRHATPLARRMFTAVLVIGAARAGTLGVGIVARQVDPNGRALEVVSWLIALAIPAIALAFLVGLLRWRLFAGRALQRLADSLRQMPNAASLRQGFAEAFADPSIQIAFPAPRPEGSWMDCWGQPTSLPTAGHGRAVKEVRDEGGAVVAAIVHDEALRTSPRLIDAGVALAGVVLENQRLAAEAEVAMGEVRRSRARIAATAERERRRIERDLHDGAQQRLVALRIELELAEELIRRDPEEGIARIHQLEQEVDDALEDLRSLAHGVYPPLLADSGLAEALRAAALRSSAPVEVQVHEVGRYPPEVESAVYFCVLEALQNVLKHAAGARRTVVRVEGTLGELRFSVRDDGAGVADRDWAPGAGITNMHDRLEALGGALEVSSKPGVGTTVRGRVPASGHTGV